MALPQKGAEPVSEVLDGEGPVYFIGFKEPLGMPEEFFKQEPAQVCDGRQPEEAPLIPLQFFERFRVVSAEVRECV
jgi:hypothetical protein